MINQRESKQFRIDRLPKLLSRDMNTKKKTKKTQN